MTAPALYVGTVHHRRFRPRPHRLSYRVFMLLLDLDRLDDLAAPSRLLSTNRWNLLSFHEGDHGPAGEGTLAARIRSLASERGVPWDGTSLTLLAMPRVFGHVFNPLSLYFCRDADGHLAAIIYEVRNTFGGMHHYCVAVEADTAGTIHQRAAKDFYVSPFLPMAMEYRFHVKPPGGEVVIAIEDRDADGLMLTAAMALRHREVSTANVLGLLLRLPFLGLKVLGAIHFEALRLWLKRIPFHPRPRARA